MTDWSTLTHAYGDATDLPALLARLSPDPDADVWYELWSRLCHQGTVYSASFAALPALANAAEQWKPAERAQSLALAAAILASDDVQGCRDDLLSPVAWVVPHFQQLCRDSLAEGGTSQTEFIHLMQAARASDGDPFWGQQLDHLASGEFSGVCPSCGTDLYLVIGEHGFFTTAEEWIRRPETHRTAIEPNGRALPGVGRWLFETARRAHQQEVAGWIPYVFGNGVCPKCDRIFAVADAIGAP